MIKKYSSREELLKNHPTAKWEEYGPIHKHGDKYFIQVYVGQHEHIAINVDDANDRYTDPGWIGTEYGYGFVSIDSVPSFWVTKGEVSEPERDGKSITADEVLFADKQKLIDYLGPEDSISKSFKKSEK